MAKLKREKHSGWVIKYFHKKLSRGNNLCTSGPHCVGLTYELENVQKRAARFVTRNYTFEEGSMTGILAELKWKTVQK